MDAPAMVTRKHVPEDVGLRNVGEDEVAAGGQGQLHREEKQHKPVLKKVKEKVKKIKNTLAGHGHGGERGSDERGPGDAAGSTSSEEGEEDTAEREAALERGGYMEDVEDKPVVTESDPEVHGAPMYESARAPAVQDLVAKYDPARKPAGQEVEGDGTPGVRLGDLGGPVVEDPAAPRSTTPAAREGEDIGTTPVVQQFETMNLSDDPAHVGVGKKDAKVEEWKDAAADKMGGAASGASYTDKLKNAAAGTTEYGKKLASTVYEKVAGAGTAVGAGRRDDERTEAAPASDAGTEERKDAPAATDATNGSSGTGYTDKIKSAAAGTTEYGKQLASTVYEKVAGVGTAVAPNLRPQVGAGKPEDARSESMPVSDTGAEAEDWKDAPAATDATNDSASAPGYTDKIKSAAAGTTEYGKQLASTVYEKVAGVGAAVAGKAQQATKSAGTATPGVGAQQQDTSAAAATPGAGGQDKGVTVTGYVAEKLRPGDEDRALSEAISGAVQRRKQDVGGTVAQCVPAPGQVMTKAREAVTSLTGGNRVSETVQPSTATGEEVKEGYAAEAPVIHGEEIGGARLNTNTM
ncbi:low-temperature-induced 65 kDa protein [Panicum miliaceum]|uniref:Low-temperature-induced 65 kDa protein n=1 Tax=Panicum miliaceum TaxID=4540 RepID=A0A3L6SBW5_PANMI|nr:low-temperature-induced 65 kDa protein [Panicum miliaceum]